MKIDTGKGTISLLTLLAIWSISALCSLPGLAVSPILGDLQKIFPKASELDIQLLSSLPSLLIIPFVLLSGSLTRKVEGLLILRIGLVIFAVSGGLYLLATSVAELLWVSVLLGIGSGLIIPLSTGLVSRYFTGKYRTQQFGYSSAINNLTLVVCTSLTGWLAEVNWHLPFVVYLFPILSIVLLRWLKPSSETQVQAPAPTDQSAAQKRAIHMQELAAQYPSFGKYGIAVRPLITLMLFYGLITYIVIIVSFNLPFLMNEYGMSGEQSGMMISLFFLAMMLPGFFLNLILSYLGRSAKLWSLVAILIGIILIIVSRSEWLMTIGCVFMGFGYGVAQPLVYDQTSRIALPRSVTLALACVMAMNYVAILLCPFIVDGLQSLLHIKTQSFAFWLNGIITLGMIGWAIINFENYLFNEEYEK